MLVKYRDASVSVALTSFNFFPEISQSAVVSLNIGLLTLGTF